MLAISLALAWIRDPLAVYRICCAFCNRIVSSVIHWSAVWSSSGGITSCACGPSISSMSCRFHRPCRMSPANSVYFHMCSSANSTRMRTHRCDRGRLWCRKRIRCSSIFLRWSCRKSINVGCEQVVLTCACAWSSAVASLARLRECAIQSYRCLTNLLLCRAYIGVLVLLRVAMRGVLNWLHLAGDFCWIRTRSLWFRYTWKWWRWAICWRDSFVGTWSRHHVHGPCGVIARRNSSALHWWKMISLFAGGLPVEHPAIRSAMWIPWSCISHVSRGLVRSGCAFTQVSVWYRCALIARMESSSWLYWRWPTAAPRWFVACQNRLIADLQSE
jgi:hypothetical protein